MFLRETKRSTAKEMNTGKKHISLRGHGTRQPVARTVAAMISEAFADRPGPVIIAVGGPGGTGKSTFSRSLARSLPDAGVLELDNYRTSREARAARGIYGSDPDANEMSMLRKHLALIRAGTAFARPAYDISRGIADTTVPYEPKRFTILDGEISTYEHFRDQIDFSVFVDAHWRTQLAARIRRDVEERDAPPEKAVRTFLQSNCIDAATYSAEARKYADVILFREEDCRLVFDAVAEPYERAARAVCGTGPSERDLAGLVVPILTPFTEKDMFDEDSFLRHLAWCGDAGVRRIMVNGTTGEFFSLSREERRRTLYAARHHFDGVLFAHVGCGALNDTIEEARWAQRHGADVIVAVAPYYPANALPRGLIEYFNEVSRAVSVPFLIYNFPRHTQNPVTPRVLAEVQHFGMKDSSTTLSLIDATPHYYVGGDPAILDAYGRGAFGFVSAHANIVPWIHVSMERALAEGDRETAARAHKDLAAVSRAFSGPQQIPRFKHAVSLMLDGYPARVRPPLAPLDASVVQETAEFVHTYWRGRR
ncbi:MAG: hypothetical protein GF418_15750 [Chitinivibrionales bacterium]|nr:hypothetical protein [Chitinivibrionales bacterium]MBD3397076.1 hypothetical protein [Chitinivibrionales bacterium]